MSDEENVFFDKEDIFPAEKNNEDTYFSEEELAEMEKHESEKIAKGNDKKRKNIFDNIRGFHFGKIKLKIIFTIVGIAAVLVYLLFSTDPIASLYRQNFKTNINRLFPAVYQNKSLIDYTLDDDEMMNVDMDGSDDGSEVKNGEEAEMISELDSEENITKKSEVRLSVMIPFDSATKTKFRKFKSGLLCAASNRMYYIEKDGQVKIDKETDVVDPILRVNGTYAVLAQENGGIHELYENGERIYKKTSDENIVTCNLSAKGDVTLVTQRENYRGGVSVYNKAGTQIFSWSSGQNNVMCAAYSSSSKKLAVVLVNADNEVYSSIKIFDVNDGREETSLVFKDTLLFDMSYTSNIITVFGDNSMITLTQGGEIISDRRFDNVELSHFAYDMLGNKTVVFDSDNIPVMQTYNLRSGVKKEMFINELADCVDISGKYLLYNSGRDVILRREGSDTVKVYTAPMDVTGLVLINSDSFAVIHSNCVEIIRL